MSNDYSSYSFSSSYSSYSNGKQTKKSGATVKQITSGDTQYEVKETVNDDVHQLEEKLKNLKTGQTKKINSSWQNSGRAAPLNELCSKGQPPPQLKLAPIDHFEGDYPLKGSAEKRIVRTI